MRIELSRLAEAFRRGSGTVGDQIVPVDGGGSPAPPQESLRAISYGQRHAGNAAVAGLLASIEQQGRASQSDRSAARSSALTPLARIVGAAPTNGGASALLREETATAPAAGSAAPSWDPAHFYEGDGLIPVTDHAQARNNLEMVSLTMQQLAEWGIPLAAIMQGKADQARAAMPEEGALTAAEVDSLKILGESSLLVYVGGMRQMNADYTRALNDYKAPPELDEASDKAADALHDAFHKDESTLAKAKELSEKVHVAEDNMHYLTEWAEQSLNEVKMLDAEGIMAAHYMDTAKSTFAHIAERAGEVCAWALAIHGALQAVWSTAGAIAAANDPSQTSAQQGAQGLEAGMSAVSGILSAGVLVGLEGAASVGLVWADLILPETQLGLQAVEHMDETLGGGTLELQRPIWEDAVTQGTGPPVLPAPALAAKWFPGGQAMLDYMWAVFQGNPPEQASAEVTKFFYDTRKKMNLEHSQADQLETSWHLFGPNEVKNLKDWVVANKEEVWGMLYGSLPHP